MHNIAVCSSLNILLVGVISRCLCGSARCEIYFRNVVVKIKIASFSCHNVLARFLKIINTSPKLLPN